MDSQLFSTICIVWAIIGVLTFILLQFVTAPYGRHIRSGWGLEIPNKLGWILMEAPSLLIMVYFTSQNQLSNYALMMGLLWIAHYTYRTLIFPFLLRTKGKKMPVSIVISAIFFNLINAGLNGYYLGNLESYSDIEFTSYHFYVGSALFLVGLWIHVKSDQILIHLRKPNETNYKIPYGFLFEYISCPNHFGEILQWAGFGIMAWNYPALTFFIWTGANLIPRALKHHKWYKEKFEEYPKKRKAVFPGIL